MCISLVVEGPVSNPAYLLLYILTKRLRQYLHVRIEVGEQFVCLFICLFFSETNITVLLIAFMDTNHLSD